MASLLEGRQYGLSSQGHPSDTKTKLIVKLTEAALRAIEEYLVFRGNTSKQPTIQFRGNEGVIVFPSSQHADSDHSFKFSFSPASETESPQGSFECIQQCGPRSLVSLGGMQYKMQIHAKDDVYVHTKQRITNAEEESKKNCTKEINVGTSVVGKKVKVKKPYVPIPPKASPPYGPSKQKPFSIMGHASNGRNKHHFQKAAASLPTTTVNRKGLLGKAVLEKGNTEIGKRPYRERIIQLLALRSYRKPELIARLMKDGIKEKDAKPGFLSNVVDSILNAVAVRRDDVYSLVKHIWAEVHEDWAFYSDADRQLLRSRRPSPAPSEDAAVSASSLSPSPSTVPQRRPLLQSSSRSDPIPTKRQRISHYMHKSDAPLSAKADSSQHISHKPDSNFLNGSSAKPEPDYSIGHHTQRFVEPSRGDRDRDRDRDPTTTSSQMSNGGEPLQKPDSNGNSKGSVPSVGKVSSTTNGTTHSWSRSSYSPESSDSQDSKVLHGAHSTSNSSGAMASPSSPDPYDYLKKYTPITNQDQRTRYKADFNADYQEYRKVHAVIDPVSRKFAELEGSLKATANGSDEWTRIKDKILREYQVNKCNSKYQDAKQRFQILHDKLAHIKRLVLEYDVSQANDAVR